jgi:hypothetical protein
MLPPSGRIWQLISPDWHDKKKWREKRVLKSFYLFNRKEMRNSFNSLIVVLTVIDSILCVLMNAEYTFARAFSLRHQYYKTFLPYDLPMGRNKLEFLSRVGFSNIYLIWEYGRSLPE